MEPVSVGIDPSANATGVVIVDAKGRPLLSELILPKCTGLDRLVFIRRRLNAIFLGMPPLKIGVRESYSMGSTNRPFLLGEVGGIVQLALHDYAERVEECAPKALKKFTTSNASASKDEMMIAIEERWGQRYVDDNLADAYALARLGLTLLDPHSSQMRDQREVVAKIVAPKKKRNDPFRLRRDVV